MTSKGQNPSSMSLLCGAHIPEDAGDVSEPAVLKLEEASGHLEGFPTDCQVSPLSSTSAGMRPRTCHLMSSQVLLVLQALEPPFENHCFRPRHKGHCHLPVCATTPQSSEAPQAVQLARNVPLQQCPLGGSVISAWRPGAWVLFPEGNRSGSQPPFPPPSVCLGRVWLHSQHPHFLV